MTIVPIHADKTAATPPAWDKFRGEIERPLDRVSSTFEFPSLRPIHEVGRRSKSGPRRSL